MLSKPSSSSWSGSGPWSYWAQDLASLFKERKDSQLVTIYQCWQVVSLSQQLGILPVFREWKGTRMGKERIVVLVWAESYHLDLMLWGWWVFSSSCNGFELLFQLNETLFQKYSSWFPITSDAWNVAVCSPHHCKFVIDLSGDVRIKHSPRIFFGSPPILTEHAKKGQRRAVLCFWLIKLLFLLYLFILFC